MDVFACHTLKEKVLLCTMCLRAECKTHCLFSQQVFDTDHNGHLAELTSVEVVPHAPRHVDNDLEHVILEYTMCSHRVRGEG